VVGASGAKSALRVLIAEEDARLWASPPCTLKRLPKKTTAVSSVFFIGEVSDYGLRFSRRGDRRCRLRFVPRAHRKKRDWHELQLHNIPEATGDFERLSPRVRGLGFGLIAGHCETNRCFFIPTGEIFPTTLGLGEKPSSRCGQASKAPERSRRVRGTFTPASRSPRF